MFRGVQGMFLGVPGCYGVFQGCPRGVPGFTDTRKNFCMHV